MRKFGRYLLDDRLYLGNHTEVWRAHAEATNDSVIMKLPVDEYPTQLQISSIKHEYDILQKLNTMEGVIHPVEFVVSGHSCGMVLEDNGETMLSDYLSNKPFSLEEFIYIAIQLVKIIGELHEKGVINKDIKLENILINISTKRVRVIDFSIASELSREYQEFSHPDYLEGTLAYISPEQTGRMNRAIDYRTDFYSLGITFYKMLTGRFPFEATTAMEMVHAHIAKLPQFPSKIIPSIPTVISKIVMKLLEKNCDDRYKSTRSLIEDLEQCSNELKKSGKISDFEIAKNDIPIRFLVSQKLYGRENEINILLETFKSVSQGESKIVFIKGYSGVGKTALINEIHRPITEQKGFFLQGKFDQFKKDIAYSAIGAALQNLAQQLLHLQEKELQEWKNNILQAVGKNGRILTDLASDLEKIIGIQPKLDELPSQQTLSRFYYTLHEFIRIIATKEHPLVIFLDDLQWADHGSLDLISDIGSSDVSKHLLLIGAYRSSEVMVGHPFYQVIEKLRTSRSLIELELAPLNQDSVLDLIADTLYVEKNTAKLLSQFVYQKTEGNPFYINVLLNTFYRENLIYFDYSKGEWLWDLDKIQAQKVSENIVEYLLDRLRQLPESTQQVVQLAACIGSTFDLTMLSVINVHSSVMTAQALESAIAKGIIIPVSKEYRVVTAELQEYKNDQPFQFNVYYQFAHDKVQQAAYQLLEERKRIEIHLAIARLFWKNIKNLNEEDKHKETITIAHHYNLANSLLTDPLERKLVIELNYEAALHARKSSAFQMILQNCEYAKNLLPENPWDNLYELTFNIYSLYVESAYLLAKYDEADSMCELLFQHAKSNFEKAKVMYMKSLQYIAINDYKKAFPVSVEALRLLGVDLSLQPSIFKVIWKFTQTLFRLAKVVPAELKKKSFTLDERLNLIPRALTAAMSSAYFTSKVNFMGVALYAAVYLLLDYPITRGSPNYCDTLMILYAQTFKNYNKANEWYKLAKDLNESHPEAEVFLSSTICYLTFLSLLFQHEHDIHKTIKKGLAVTLESGNKYYIPMFYALLFLTKPGVNAVEICQLASEHYALIKEVAIRDMLEMFLLRYAYYYNITGKTPSYDSILFEHFDENEFLSRIPNATYHVIPYIYYTVKMRLAYLYGDYDAAQRYLDQAFRFKGTEVVIFNLREVYLYSFLIPAKRWKSLNFFQKMAAKRQMNSGYTWIKRWADFCPMNFSHYKYLLDAEAAQIKGDLYNAQLYYDKAIIAANQNNYPAIETFIHEQAALFYLKNNLNRYASYEMQLVLLGYQQQGASRKVEHLLKLYPDLFLVKEGRAAISFRESSKKISSSSTEESLDLDTIINVSKTITGEIEIDKLLEKMLKILIENAGAEKGILVIKSGHDWLIQGQGTTNHIEVLQKIPLDQAEKNNVLFCRSIIDYVIRSGTVLVLGNAYQSDEFRNDPYIIANRSRSIFCLPLINQGVMRGLLYLENNITSDAFNASRQKTLLSISAQAAIAIENATLYENLKILNFSYEQFVPKEFLNVLEKESIVDVSLGDQTLKEMTVMFADIRNFTHLSEQMTPQETFNFLNLFLSYMEPVIKEHHGFIDKYIGDAIMALFPNANDAIQCSVIMLEKLNEFNKMNPTYAIRIGIGLNTGQLTLGIVGGKNHLETTVISDTVNIASRVESLNKNYHTEILITENTLKSITNTRLYYYRSISNAKLRGKEIRLKIYEVFNHNENSLKKQKLESREIFENAVELYEDKKYEQANAIFSELLAIESRDTVCQIYLTRLKSKYEH